MYQQFDRADALAGRLGDDPIAELQQRRLPQRIRRVNQVVGFRRRELVREHADEGTGSQLALDQGQETSITARRMISGDVLK